mmetsp:Transcript_14893/g.36007  ORF Transcript_14893/g.36007 Transcript_14893/m.36007 type:complete len:283 (-) Transcript_14893:780-1628(-)
MSAPSSSGASRLGPALLRCEVEACVMSGAAAAAWAAARRANAAGMSNTASLPAFPLLAAIWEATPDAAKATAVTADWTAATAAASEAPADDLRSCFCSAAAPPMAAWMRYRSLVFAPESAVSLSATVRASFAAASTASVATCTRLASATMSFRSLAGSTGLMMMTPPPPPMTRPPPPAHSRSSSSPSNAEYPCRSCRLFNERIVLSSFARLRMLAMPLLPGLNMRQQQATTAAMIAAQNPTTMPCAAGCSSHAVLPLLEAWVTGQRLQPAAPCPLTVPDPHA